MSHYDFMIILSCMPHVAFFTVLTVSFNSGGVQFLYFILSSTVLSIISLLGDIIPSLVLMHMRTHIEYTHKSKSI